MSNMSDTLRSDVLRKAQVTSLVSGHPSSNVQDPFYLSEHLPEELVNEIESFQSPAEDLRRRMTEPASVYKPDSKLAMILNIFPKYDTQDSISCIFLDSLHSNDVAVLPLICLHQDLPERISAKDIDMLLSLPAGRVEQIDTLFVQFILDYRRRTLDQIRDDVAIALEQLNFVLTRVTRLVVTSPCRWKGRVMNLKEIVPAELDFDFSKAKDKYLSLTHALKWFPLDCNNIIDLQTSMEVLCRQFPECAIASALIGMCLQSENSLPSIYGLENVRWMIRHAPTVMAEEMKKQINGLITPYSDETVDLSQFPNISDLDIKCKLFTPLGFSHLSLVSLVCYINWPEGLKDLFALRLPELRQLAVNGHPNMDYTGPLVFRFQRLIEFSLLFFNKNVIINMIDLVVKFGILSLRCFYGNFIETNNLRIDTLRVDECTTTPLLYQLCLHASRVEYTYSSQIDSPHPAVDILFDRINDIRIHRDSDEPRLFASLESRKVSNLQTLDLHLMIITILPMMFPSMQKLTLVKCVVRLYSDTEENASQLNFRSLASLSVIHSTMTNQKYYRKLITKNTCIDATMRHFVRASRLKKIYIDGMVNDDCLIFSSEHCGELEVINWTYDQSKDLYMPFLVTDSKSTCFSKLRTLSMSGMFTESSDEERSGLTLTFPLDRVVVLHLLGNLVVPNLHRMLLSCQRALFSADFVYLNFKHDIELSDLRQPFPSTWSLDKLRRSVHTIMPEAEVLILQDKLDTQSAKNGSIIAHIKKNSKYEEVDTQSVKNGSIIAHVEENSKYEQVDAQSVKNGSIIAHVEENSMYEKVGTLQNPLITGVPRALSHDDHFCGCCFDT